ncbi:hypothetical protein KAR91_17200, partial [Candidatus Pacearchaeota archaeon]|nr:hypothetical protein [Candidatus Pacearchaeota archaeon]
MGRGENAKSIETNNEYPSIGDCMPKPKIVKKQSNPKAAMGIKKVPMSCLSSQSMALVAQAMVAEKVLLQETDVYVSEQFSAAVAHLMLFWEGYNDAYRIPH